MIEAIKCSMNDCMHCYSGRCIASMVVHIVKSENCQPVCSTYAYSPYLKMSVGEVKGYAIQSSLPQQDIFKEAQR